MKKYVVVHSEKVVQDIDDIYSYISVDLNNPKAAHDLYIKIKATIKSLEYSPKRFRLVDNDNPNLIGVRIAHVGKYNIFYKIEDGHKVVLVLSILYSGVDIKKLKLDN